MECKAAEMGAALRQYAKRSAVSKVPDSVMKEVVQILEQAEPGSEILRIATQHARRKSANQTCAKIQTALLLQIADALDACAGR